jgi:hypothetical protein
MARLGYSIYVIPKLKIMWEEDNTVLKRETNKSSYDTYTQNWIGTNSNFCEVKAN